VIGEPVAVLVGVELPFVGVELLLVGVELALVEGFAAAALLFELLLPQADSANPLIRHAATTTRNDFGRRTRAQMLSCGGMLPNLPGGSQRGCTARH
jgi:hypothetical protein